MRICERCNKVLYDNNKCDCRDLNLFYVTFGLGTPLRNRYMPVFATDEYAVRVAMNYQFNSKWAFVYSEDNFDIKRHEEEFGEIALPTINVGNAEEYEEEC